MSGYGKLLLLGFAALLVLGLVLWRNAASDEAATAPAVGPVAPPSTTTTPHVEDAPATPVATPNRVTDVIGALAKHASSTPPPAIAADVPKPPEDEIKYRDDGVPIAVADLELLRKVTPASDAAVNECIRQHGGASLTGTVMTTFIVARKRNPSGTFAVEVEATGFEEDGTTIQDPALIECLHKTAFAIKFPASDSPVGTWARRRISILGGQLDENWIVKHGHIR